MRPTILVDGIVAGCWGVRNLQLTVEPMTRLNRGQTNELHGEIDRLLDLLSADAGGAWSVDFV